VAWRWGVEDACFGPADTLCKPSATTTAAGCDIGVNMVVLLYPLSMSAHVALQACCCSKV
jgi:hypothetical protein